MFYQTRATARRLALVSCVGLLAAGCVYDPYTGTYVPCCTYPTYGYAGAPPYPRPYPAPAGAPPGQLSGEPGRIESEPPPPQPGQATGEPKFVQRFQQANVTGDGRLTVQQAQAAGWKLVARNFQAIDTQRRGYVTLDDVQAWMASRRPNAASPPQG